MQMTSWWRHLCKPIKPLFAQLCALFFIQFKDVFLYIYTTLNDMYYFDNYYILIIFIVDYFMSQLDFLRAW